jgi:anti-sigma factor RsiW
MTPLSCASVRRRLTAYHDRELSIEQLIAIEAHLDGCPPCASEAESLETLGDSLRVGAAALQPGTDVLAGLQPGIISRMKAENAQSWRAQFGRMFEDMHLVWIGLGSAMATVICSALALACLHFASPERDDSLAGIIATMASSRANLVRQVPANTYDDVVGNALVRSMSEEEAVLALAAVVTRDGRLIDPRWVENDNNRQQILGLMNAIEASRFDTTRAGGSSSVNMVWLFAHTTVRGKIVG